MFFSVAVSINPFDCNVFLSVPASCLPPVLYPTSSSTNKTSHIPAKGAPTPDSGVISHETVTIITDGGVVSRSEDATTTPGWGTTPKKIGTTEITPIKESVTPDGGIEKIPSGAVLIPRDMSVTCRVLSATAVRCHLEHMVLHHPHTSITITANVCHVPVDFTFSLQVSFQLS